MNKILILLFSFVTIVLQAQNEITEKELIRATVNEYIEGRNSGEVERLQSAFLPNANLKGISGKKEQVVTPIADYVAKQTPGRKHNCTSEIRFIDFVKEVAVAQVVLTYTTHTYYDYLILMKVNDKWMISDKIYTRKEAETRTP